MPIPLMTAASSSMAQVSAEPVRQEAVTVCQLITEIKALRTLLEQQPRPYGDVEASANSVMGKIGACPVCKVCAQSCAELLEALLSLPEEGVERQKTTMITFVLEMLSRHGAQEQWRRSSPCDLADLAEQIAVTDQPETRDAMAQVGGALLSRPLTQDGGWTGSVLCRLISAIPEVLPFRGARASLSCLLEELGKRELTKEEGVTIGDLSVLALAFSEFEMPEEGEAARQGLLEQIAHRSWEKETDWDEWDMARLATQLTACHGDLAQAAREKVAAQIAQSLVWQRPEPESGTWMHYTAQAIADWQGPMAGAARGKLLKDIANCEQAQGQEMDVGLQAAMAQAIRSWKDKTAPVTRARVAEQIARCGLTQESGGSVLILCKLADAVANWRGLAAEEAQARIAQEVNRRALTDAEGFGNEHVSLLVEAIGKWRGEAAERAWDKLTAEVLSRLQASETPWPYSEQIAMLEALGVASGESAEEIRNLVAKMFVRGLRRGASLAGWAPDQLATVVDGFSRGSGYWTKEALEACAKAIGRIPGEQIATQWPTAVRLKMSNALAGDQSSDSVMKALDKLETDRRGDQEVDDRPLGHVQP